MLLAKIIVNKDIIDTALRSKADGRSLAVTFGVFGVIHNNLFNYRAII